MTGISRLPGSPRFSEFWGTERNGRANRPERGGQPAVEWTWEGMDEMDPCAGRGWVVLEGNELCGIIFFHQGDESGFVAKRSPKRRRPKWK